MLKNDMTTTTYHFQKKPDYYSSAEICLLNEKKRENTNPRYKFFTQTHFTAGDVEQFEHYRDKSNGVSLNETDYKNESPIKMPSLNWEKYQNLDYSSVDNTFNYIFHKFKKGIFIKIKNGELRTFLPFSKKNFVNEWSNLIKIDPKFRDLTDFLGYVQRNEGRNFNPKNVNRFIDSWYANNCLFRWEFPINEGDTGVCIASDMFKTLCLERKVCDIEFFVNRRDFPLLKRNGTEAYEHIFGDNHPLVSHDYKTYAPILSMVSTSEHADIPIPTGDDWARVCREEGKFFPKTAKRDYQMNGAPWETKKPVAVFRGGSTGAGTTIETNPRLKLAYLSKITPKDRDGLPLLDAGITEWNLRPRKNKHSPYLQTIDPRSMPFTLVNRLTPNEQTSYKYLINVDGHVSAFRLGLELGSGCCILLVTSKYKIWFRHLLKPFVHYIPVNGDLSDLVEKIKWCKANDNKCKEIAENAVEFYKRYLTKDGILDYLQQLLYNLKVINGDYFYNIRPVLAIIRDRELEQLQILTDILPVTALTGTQYKRDYGTFKAIQSLSFDTFLSESEVIFNNNNTQITKFKIGEQVFIYKKSSKDLIHEAFVSLFGTNQLLKQIPNFSFIFKYVDSGIVSEFIEGTTLFDYINSEQFNMDEFIWILLQLCLSLHCAQRTCMFVHHDLTPWNVMIKRLSSPTIIDYAIQAGTIYRIKTSVIPIIIDMNSSHICYDNFHYGKIKPFSFSSIQDILSILSTSVFAIAKRTINRKDASELIRLANFISGTKYKNRPFVYSGSDGLSDVRYFFGKTKKYSELIYSDKYDLEEKTPLQFIQYIRENFKLSNEIKTSNTLQYHLNYTNCDKLLGRKIEICKENLGDLYEQIKNPKLQEKLERMIKELPDPIVLDDEIHFDIDTFNNPGELLFIMEKHEFIKSEFVDDVFIEKYFPYYNMDYKTRKYITDINTLYIIASDVSLANLTAKTCKEKLFKKIIELKKMYIE